MVRLLVWSSLCLFGMKSLESWWSWCSYYRELGQLSCIRLEASLESESVSLLSPVKTRCTYGPTIVAIAQGPFVWKFIETVTSYTDLLIEDVLSKKENPLQDVFPVLYVFVILNISTQGHVNTTHVPLVVYFANPTLLLDAFSSFLTKFHSVNPFNGNHCEPNRAHSQRKRWNFHLRLSAKRVLFYFRPKCWEGHEKALIKTIRKETKLTEELEEAGYRSPTWAVLRAAGVLGRPRASAE